MRSLLSFRFAAPIVFAGWCLVFSGCDQSPDVRSTTPADGEDNVDPKAQIRITFSGTFNSNSDKQDKLTNAGNIVVTGESGQSYEGTITVATRSGTPAAAPAADTKSQTTGTTNGTDTTKKAARSSGQSDNDTLIFSLANGGSFLIGDVVTVQVGGDVTIRGTPIKHHRFTFRVRDQAAVGGSLRVLSTSPAPEQLGLGERPRVTVSFTQPVKPDGLMNGFVISGEQSGTHAGGTICFSLKDAQGNVTEAVQRLAQDGKLLAGEWVNVSLTREIQGTGSVPASSNLTNPTDILRAAQTANSLPPFSFRFQTASGVVPGTWSAAHAAPGPEEPLRLRAGQVRSGGPAELAVVGRDEVDLLSYRTDQKSVVVEKLKRSEDQGKIVDGTMADVDGDGLTDIVLLLTGTQGSELQIYGSASGESTLTQTLEFPATGARRLFVTDIDSNGFSDFLITHSSRDYTVEKDGNKQQKSTGNLTIFEMSLGAPDPTKLLSNPTDTSALRGTPAFNLVENPIPELALVDRVETHDLDGDGLPDLIAEAPADGRQSARLILAQNRGTASDRFRFRGLRELKGRDGQTSLVPRNWVVVDIDGDADLDVLAWDEAGALVYQNSLDPKKQNPREFVVRGLLYQDVQPLPRPELPQAAAGGPPAQALDLDGDQSLDLVLADRQAGKLRLLLNASQAQGAKLVELPVQVGGLLADVAVLDFDGDTGLDLAVIGDGSAGGNRIAILSATGVTPAKAVGTNSFRLDPELSRVGTETIEAVVVGDIAEGFKGYTLALDFDESRLELVEFRRPARFVDDTGVAFDVCPSEGKTCSGFSIVTMTYNGARSGGELEGLDLGTFVFKPKTVRAQETAVIELKNELTGPNGKVSNGLAVAGGCQLPVELSGDPLLVPVKPPAPILLMVTESKVLRLENNAFRSRVVLASPARASFSEFQVSVDGVAVLSEKIACDPDPAKYCLEFDVEKGGVHTIQVRGFGEDGREAAVVEATLITVFPPQVQCFTRIVAPTDRVVEVVWTIQDENTVDGFQVWRNGRPLSSILPATQLAFVDELPSLTASELYQVAGVVKHGGGQVVGPRGDCTSSDPIPTETEAPRPSPITFAAEAPNPIVLRFAWSNEEAYDKIDLAVLVDDGTPKGREVYRNPDLPGGDTEFLYHGESTPTGVMPPGGVPPQFYRFTVVGVKTDGARTVRSTESISGRFTVRVPPLGQGFHCSNPVGNEVLVTWDPVWEGYTGLSLIVKGPESEVREVALPFHATEFRDTVFPKGEYNFTLKAKYDKPLPAAFPFNPLSLEQHCAEPLRFRPALEAGKVETGIGLARVLVPVRADLFAPISGFTFTLTYPSVLQVSLPDSSKPETAVKLNGRQSGPPPRVTLAAVAGQPSRKKITVQVEGGWFPAGTDQVLLWVVGSIPAEFSAAGTYPLRFEAEPTITPLNEDTVKVAADDAQGQLLVRRRFMLVDQVEVRADDSQPHEINVRATFDYRLKGIFVALEWDAQLIEMLPFRMSDQSRTMIEGKGEYINLLGEDARRLGRMAVFFLPSDNAESLPPAINRSLLLTKFRAKALDSPVGKFVKISILRTSDQSQKDGPLTPEKDPGDGPVIEAFFDGGLDIVPVRDAPTLVSVVPTRGGLSGGGKAMVNGFALTDGLSNPEQDIALWLVHRRFPGATPDERKATITHADNYLVEFEIPASNLNPVPEVSAEFDVELRSPLGTSVLERGYLYERLRLAAADRTQISASGGDLVTIFGNGIPAAHGRIEVRVAGQKVASVESGLEVDSDGRKIAFRTPPLAQYAGSLVDIFVVAPTVLDGQGNPSGWIEERVPVAFSVATTPSVISVVPERGPAVGGTEVTVEVVGFPQALDKGGPLDVRFGAAAGSSVRATGATTLKATSPAGSAGRVNLSVRQGVSEAIGSFEYYVPKVEAVEPAEGPLAGGTQVAVRFSGFGTGNMEVFFGTITANVVKVEGDIVTVTSPAQTAAGPVLVKVKQAALEAALPGAFLYHDPRLGSLTPNSGPTAGNTPVEITLIDFPLPLKAPQVRFGSNAATIQDQNGNKLSVLSPAGPGPGPIKVEVTDGQYSASLAGAFTYQGEASLSINTVEPNTASICGGEKVVIKGAGFGSSLQVRFGEQVSTAVTVRGAGEAEVTVPAAPETARAVTIGVSLDGISFIDKAEAFSYRDVRGLFLRGDVDANGKVDVSDTVALADFLTGVLRTLVHQDAADANDDGRIDTGDLVALSGHLFLGTGGLPSPSGPPGTDLTADELRGCPR